MILKSAFVHNPKPGQCLDMTYRNAVRLAGDVTGSALVQAGNNLSLGRRLWRRRSGGALGIGKNGESASNDNSGEAHLGSVVSGVYYV
jgi:hypothetical protein